MVDIKPHGFFKLPFFGTGEKTSSKKKSPPRLKMIFFIIDWNKSQDVFNLFDEEKISIHFITKGMGTAKSEVLNLLGIGANDKAVIICVEQEVLIPILFKEARKKLGFHTPGTGIAFTVPLSGINTPLLRVFKDSIDMNEKTAVKGKGEIMAEEKKAAIPAEVNHDLIIAVINHGYSDDFMNAARDAGASGGTVIHARGLAHEGPVKFFGVSFQEEKEVVLILTSREKKLPIMEAVSLSHGITSEAEGIILSLPVDSVMGLNLE